VQLDLAPLPLTCLVTGAGGFVGGHLVARLLAEGQAVRGVDIKPPHAWDQLHADADNRTADLRHRNSCLSACQGIDDVYNLAADMGGMGFIETHKVDCMLTVLISANMLAAAAASMVGRFFYSSSACVYAADKQTETHVTALKEADAYPAMPEDGYGWEKLFTERLCRHFGEEMGLATRVARFHNVYGPLGTFDGGREKAPAAICRKVIQARLSGRHEIDIWGDGEQTRSFMYIDDCIEGTRRIMESDAPEPINLGSNELVTINRLVDIAESFAGIRLKRTYDLSAPQGVRGRNSDNTMILEKLGWQPSTRLESGLHQTYAWIWDEMATPR